MSEWLFTAEPAQEGIFDAVSKLFHRKKESQKSDNVVRVVDKAKLLAEHPYFKRMTPEKLLEMWFENTEDGQDTYTAAREDPMRSDAKVNLRNFITGPHTPSSKETKLIKVRGIDVSWDPVYYEYYLWTQDEFRSGGHFIEFSVDEIVEDLVSAGKVEPLADEWYRATESWLFNGDMEPAQEMNVLQRAMGKIGRNKTVAKIADNNLKYFNSKSKLSTDQGKAFNSNIKNYIASHDPTEIARLAAQLYSKRKGYVTGNEGKARCEDIAKRQTSRKAKNVTVEMMNGLYYVTCMKPQEGGEDEFMFFCPQVNGVYSRTLHQMAFELVGARGKSAYATESWLFD